MKTKEIAKRVGLGVRTLQRWLTQGAYVETNYHQQHRSRFDAYEAYVMRRWDEGCHNIQLMRDKLRKVNPQNNLGHSAWHQTATPRPLTSAIQPCGPKARVSGILVCCLVRPSLSLFECKG